MDSSKAFVPVYLSIKPNQFFLVGLSVFLGVGLLALSAQIKISLPWTPVPITGQTFGISLLALLWGSRLAFATIASYLILGFLGAPVFAGGASGVSLGIFGPTFGYLSGMLIASWVVGNLSDRGWGESFTKALMACYVGSAIIFFFGLLGLSFFVSTENLLHVGLIPFLPGDFLKNVLASLLVKQLSK